MAAARPMATRASGAVLLPVLCLSLLLGSPPLTLAELPPYVRGNGTYEWVLTDEQLANGVHFLGAATRLRAAMARMMQGKPLHITAIGGSNTAGDVRYDGLPWPQYLFNYLTDKYGPQVTFNNAAVGGTRSNYMAVCHNMAVPRHVDVVLVEYSLNDNDATHNEEMKRIQERLLRTLLMYPHRPAVIPVHILPWDWKEGEPVENVWWKGGDRTYNELSQYYHLPSASVRGCCFKDLMANAPGFNTTLRSKNPQALAGLSFYVDPGHVDGLTGARVVAELLMHLMDKAYASVLSRPYEGDPNAAIRAFAASQQHQQDGQPTGDAAAGTAGQASSTPGSAEAGEEERAVLAPLPPPLLHKDNYESSSHRCFIGPVFKSVVAEASGNFSWVNEAKGSRPRWGWVAWTIGSYVELKLDSRAVIPSGSEVAIYLAYLKSYHHMGQANVECVRGCTCAASTIDGHTAEKHSQQDLHKLMVTQSQECVVRVTVLDSTKSGEHKVKLTGLMVSEEAGASRDLSLDGHQGAVENVASGASRSHLGILDHSHHQHKAHEHGAHAAGAGGAGHTPRHHQHQQRQRTSQRRQLMAGSATDGNSRASGASRDWLRAWLRRRF